MRREKKPKGKNLNWYKRTNGAPENDNIGLGRAFVACVTGVMVGVGDGVRTSAVSGRVVVVALVFWAGAVYSEAKTSEESAAGFASGSNDGTRNRWSEDVPSFAGRG